MLITDQRTGAVAELKSIKLNVRLLQKCSATPNSLHFPAGSMIPALHAKLRGRRSTVQDDQTLRNRRTSSAKPLPLSH
jgi:hypothetical protein